jgi:hypothetical protein
MITMSSTTTPNKLTAEAMARISELTGRLSHRQIADRLRMEGLADVTRGAISAALRRAGPEVGASSPRPSPKATSTDVDAAVAALAADLDVMPLELVTRRLQEVTAFADELREAGNVIAYRDLVRLEADIAARIEAMRPPPIPDPELDPANLAARDELVARIDRLIAKAEGSAS